MNLSSWDQNSRISGIEKSTIARRSRPRPKAQPCLLGWPGGRRFEYVNDPLEAA